MIIEIEDEKTWPKEVSILFDKNIKLLEKSQACEIWGSRLSTNPFRSSFDSIVEDINSKIASSEVIGYHCTRLLDYEAEEIDKNGLKLPSKELLQERLKEAHKRKIISQELVDNVMRQNEYLNTPVRENMLYLVCGVSELQNIGILKFFQLWGGEAVFNSHEQSEHRETLSRIGSPIIIRAKIKPGQEKNIGKRLAYAYLIARGIPTEDTPSFDHCSRAPLLPDTILRIISVHDIEFLKLTNGYAAGFDFCQQHSTAP